MTTMTQQASADTGPVSRFAKWAPLAVVLSGTFIFVLDFFVVNVALPDIQRSLRAGPAAIEWLVSGYALTTAALLVTAAGSATTTAGGAGSAAGSRCSCSRRRCARSPLTPASWSPPASCRARAPG